MRNKLAACLLLLSGWAGAQAPVVQDPSLAAAQRWIGRALIVRGFYGDNDLKFDASGKVEGTHPSVEWTLAGVDLDAVKRVDAATLELDGVRVAIRYNYDNRFFERHPQKDQRMKILIGVRKAGSSANALLGVEPVEETLSEVFAQGIDPSLQKSTPELWRHYFDPSLPWTGDGLEGQTVYPAKGAQGTVPPGLVYPEITHKEPVSWTPEAEKDKVRAAVGLRIVLDANGTVKRVSLVRPLGYGLDARAVESVRRWTFQPAQLDGKPVAATMDVWVDVAPAPAKAPGK